MELSCEILSARFSAVPHLPGWAWGLFTSSFSISPILFFKLSNTPQNVWSILCAWLQPVSCWQASLPALLSHQIIMPRDTLCFFTSIPQLPEFPQLEQIFWANSYVSFKPPSSSPNAFPDASGLPKQPPHATILALGTVSWIYPLWMFQSSLLDFKVLEGRKHGTYRCTIVYLAHRDVPKDILKRHRLQQALCSPIVSLSFWVCTAS